MKTHDLDKRVQLALIGEVPTTLRFLYAYIEKSTFYFHAVYTDNAYDDHLECAYRVLSEIESSLPNHINVQQTIEKDSVKPWKYNDGNGLFYLRYGELSEYEIDDTVQK